MASDFSARLRAATWDEHQATESAGYVTTLVAGGLTRLPALGADLAFLVGPEWPDRIAPSPATAAYCERLREVCFDWPAGFIAHHYTRYLGDLSGGQSIRRAVVRRYGFRGGQGVAFYDFRGLGPPGAFKRGYRATLDALPYPAAELNRLVGEVRLAYRLNAAVFADLERDTQRYRDPFPPEVVAQIMRHMNDDHAADSLLIVRALGGRPDATVVRMSGMDADGIDFTVAGESVPVRVPFAYRLSERAEVRREVVRMYQEACAALGVSAR